MTTGVSFKDQAVSAFSKGFIIMGLQTPFVHPLNRISVVCSNTGYSSLRAIREVYAGTIDSVDAPKRSFWNLHRGLSGHLVKEITRLSFKPFGGAILKPKIDQTFPLSPLKASIVFAGAMSCMEVLINPADTVRVRLQSGQSLNSFYPNPIKQLYAGSLGNFMRQFGTWGTYNFSGAHLDRFFREHTTLDPKSIDGMAVKSVIQAVLLTSLVYPTFERLKNELQYNKDIEKGVSSLYKASFNGVIKRRGVVGLVHGLFPKILSNTILVYGFNWIVENGKPKPIVNPTSLQIGSLIFENSLVRISKVTFPPKEDPVMHYNEYKRMIIPLQTGSLEKVSSQGAYLGQRSFTRGIPFMSPPTNKTELHGNINRGKESLSLLIVEIKQ